MGFKEAAIFDKSSAFSFPQIILWPETQIMDNSSWPASKPKTILQLFMQWN